MKKTAFSEYDKSRREGFIAINLNEGDELCGSCGQSGDDDLLMVSKRGTAIRFAESEVRPWVAVQLECGDAATRGRRGRIVRRCP